MLTTLEGLLKLLFDKLPAGHWVLPIVCLLLVLRLVVPKINWTIKVEVGNKSRNADGRKQPPRRRPKK
jgi:hypothetical protein